MVHRYDVREQSWVEEARGSGTERAARQRRTEKWAILVSAGVLLALSVGFGVREWTGGESVRGAGQERETPVSPEGSSSAAAETGSGGAEQRVPDGYEREEDTAGWTVFVPGGWARQEEKREGQDTVVRYVSPDGDRRLEIFRVAEETLYSSITDAEEGFRKSMDGYRRNARTIPSEGGPQGEVSLRYTYEENPGGPRYVVDRRFEASDNEYYAVSASGPDGTRGQQEELAEVARTSFCPEGADCTG